MIEYCKLRNIELLQNTITQGKITLDTPKAIKPLVTIAKRMEAAKKAAKERNAVTQSTDIITDRDER